MSDTTVNRFVAQVADAAARAAFVPSPPTPAAGPDNGYFLYQQDTREVWTWDSNSSAWVKVTSGGATIPAIVQGDLLYGSAANTLSALAKDANATRYLSNTGGSNNPAWAQVNLANGVTGDLPFANLTQGSALSVLGVTGNATADNASIAAGSDHQVLRRSGTSVGFGQVNVGQSAAITGVLPVANGGTGSASGAAILRSVTNLTDANIKSLPTTPIELVAAGGANTRICPVSITVMYSFVTATYTNINATYAAFQVSWDGSAGPWAMTAIVDDAGTGTPITKFTTMFGGAVHDGIFEANVPYLLTDSTWWLPQNDVNQSYGSQVNKNLAVSIDNNGSGALTGGNAANTMRIVTYYTVESTA